MVNCLGLLALAWTLTATPTCPRAPAVTLQAPTSAGGGYPEWPEAVTTGRRELSMVLESLQRNPDIHLCRSLRRGSVVLGASHIMR